METPESPSSSIDYKVIITILRRYFHWLNDFFAGTLLPQAVSSILNFVWPAMEFVSPPPPPESMMDTGQ